MPEGPVIQCPINFSEGRRTEVIEAIALAIRSVPSASLADYSWDYDHNRMVATILGDSRAIEDAAVASAKVAVREINLRQHHGAHPRIGAVDVVPVVPIRDTNVEECVVVSMRIGRRLGEELDLPVYLYEKSALPGRRSALPEIRKGGFEGLGRHPLDGEFAPDFGPQSVHSTAGATVVGARSPLVAFNVDLTTDLVAVAKGIAADIRKNRDVVPEVRGVRALGLFLPSRNIAQVSMNLTSPDLTTLPAVFEYVRSAAKRQGTGVSESEIIGLIPRSSLSGASPDEIMWKSYKETQILEYWLV